MQCNTQFIWILMSRTQNFISVTQYFFENCSHRHNHGWKFLFCDGILFFFTCHRMGKMAFIYFSFPTSFSGMHILIFAMHKVREKIYFSLSILSCWGKKACFIFAEFGFFFKSFSSCFEDWCKYIQKS